MSFAEDLKKWRGTRCQKQVCDFFGVKLETFRAWEQGVNLPSDLARKQIYLIMAAESAGVTLATYMQHYYRAIKQVAAEIQNRK